MKRRARSMARSHAPTRPYPRVRYRERAHRRRCCCSCVPPARRLYHPDLLGMRLPLLQPVPHERRLPDAATPAPQGSRAPTPPLEHLQPLQPWWLPEQARARRPQKQGALADAMQGYGVEAAASPGLGMTGAPERPLAAVAVAAVAAAAAAASYRGKLPSRS